MSQDSHHSYALWDTLRFMQFITLSTHEYAPLLGLVRFQRHHKLWTPSPWGQAVTAGLEELRSHEGPVLSEDFVVMPNHIHLIAHFKSSDRRLSHNFVTTCKHMLASAMRAASPTTKPLWNKSFQAQTIHSQQALEALSASLCNHHERWQYDSLYVPHPTESLAKPPSLPYP